MTDKIRLLDKAQIDTIIEQAAADILLDMGDIDRFAVIGVQGGGIELAARLRKKITEITGKEIRSGTIDITFYRDDIATKGTLPVIKETKIEFDITGMRLLLVDDVIFTGRTVKAAMEAVMGFGRPAGIKLFCLIDRGGRELPIQPDYCGMKTDAAEHVSDLIKLRMYPDNSTETEEAVVILGQPEGNKWGNG